MSDQVAKPTPAVNQNLSGQVSRAMLWNGAWQVAKLLSGLLSAIVVAKLLSKEGYGTVARLSALAGTLGLVADFGVERGLAKFLPEVEARHGSAGVRSTLRLIIAQKLVIVALIACGTLLFRDRLYTYWLEGVEETDLRALIMRYHWVFFAALMAMVFFGAVFDVFMQTLTAYFKQSASGAISFVATVLSPLLRLTVVLAGWGVLGFVGALVTIPLVATSLAAWQTARVQQQLNKQPTMESNGANLPRRFVSYSALSYWQQITEYIYALDFVLLMVPGASAAASLKWAHSLIGQVIGALWSPLAGIQIPLFSRLYTRGDTRQLGDAYSLLSKFLAAVMIPAAVGLTILAYNILVLIEPKYVDATAAARIIAITFCLDAAISVPLAILMAYEQYRPMLIARSCALLALPLVFFVVPRYGIVAAALVMGGTRLFCDGLAMLMALRELPLRYPLRFALRIAGASAVMALVIAPFAFSVLRPPLPWDTASETASKLDLLTQLLYLAGNLTLAAVGGLIYLGVFKLTGGIDPEDRQRIVELRLPLATKLLRFL